MLFIPFLLVYTLIMGITIYALNIKDKHIENKEEKYINDSTIKILFWIVLSVITSLTISLNADIPESAGLGGFFWLFGPLFYGAISLFLYLFTLVLFKSAKIWAGLVYIIFNIGVGVYFYFAP